MSIWLNFYPVVLVPFLEAVLVLLVLVGLQKSERTVSVTHSELFFAVLAISCLGIVSGQFTCQSREPAVVAVIPAVLSFIGSFSVYMFAKNKEIRIPVAFLIFIFTINLFLGALWGTKIRSEYIEFVSGEEFRSEEERIKFRIEIQKIEHQRQLERLRVLAGLRSEERLN